jgi:hypothetical protein
LLQVLDRNKDKTGMLCEKDETVVVDLRSIIKMRLINRLEQWSIYPMIFLWVAAFIVGFYDAYLYLENNL